MGNRAALSLWHGRTLQRKPLRDAASDGLLDAAAAAAHAAPAGVVHAPGPSAALAPDLDGPAVPTGGNALDAGTRHQMEARFGEDFSSVRVHTGQPAERAAQALQAQAFTAGEDIVFGPGQFSPTSSAGRQLLAHELAHVVQQRNGSVGSPGSSNAEAAEHDADAAARQVMAAGQPSVQQRSTPAMVQKQEKPLATFGPQVHTSNFRMNSESPNQVTVSLQTGAIAGGVSTSFTDAHDDGGHWDNGSKVLSIRVAMREGSLKQLPGAGAVLRSLNINGATITVLNDGVETQSFTIMADPAPAKPPPIKPPKQTPAQPPPRTPPPEVLPIDFKTPLPELPRLRDQLLAGNPDLAAQAAALSNDEMKQLLPQERVKLLQSLADSADSTLANQETLLRLLQTTPNGDARTVLDGLRANDAQLAQQLANGMDWQHGQRLQSALKSLYCDSLLFGLTPRDLADKPIAPWPATSLRFDAITTTTTTTTPQGKLRFEVLPQPQQPSVPLWLGRDLFTPPSLLPRADRPAQDPLLQLFPPTTPRFPLFGKDDFLTRFLQAPAPEDPAVTAARQRAGTVSRLADDGATQDMLKQFQGLDPRSFELLQQQMGAGGMDKLLDELSDFDAVVLGSQGSVTHGSATLTEKREDYMLRIRKYGSMQSEVFYAWMFSRMNPTETDALLKKLAADKRLKDTVNAPSMAGLRKLLAARGVDLGSYHDRDWMGSDAPRGVLEGLGGMLDSGELARNFDTLSMFQEANKLPPEYRKALDDGLAALAKDWLEMPSKHPVQTFAYGVDAMLLNVPSGAFGTVAGVGSGIANLVEGNVDDAFKDFLPALILLLTHAGGKVIGGKPLGGVGVAALGSEESALLTPKRLPGGMLVAGGMEEFFQLDKKGQLFKVVIDRGTGTGSATHVASGATVYFQNGQVVSASAAAQAPIRLALPQFADGGGANALPSGTGLAPLLQLGGSRAPRQLPAWNGASFADLNSQLNPGNPAGTPMVWSVTPGGVVFATPPVPGAALVAPDGVLPPVEYFSGPGQPRSWVLSGPLLPNWTPFEVLPGKAATSRTLNQVRGTSGSNQKGAAAVLHLQQLNGGASEVTLQLPAGLERRSDLISPTVAGRLNQEVKNYLTYNGNQGPLVVPLGAFIQTEIERDAMLPHYHLQQPVYVFTNAPPSPEFIRELNVAGIPWIVSSDRLPR